MNRASAERRVVSASALLPVDTGQIFEILTDPTQHPLIDGSGMLTGDPRGPERLALGSEFSMGMQQARQHYRSLSRVVEFQEGRRIAWESMGVWRGHKIVGGQRWRWELTPDHGGTTVVHSYLWGYANLPLLTVWIPGYPARARSSLPRSLDRLRAVVLRASDPGP